MTCPVNHKIRVFLKGVDRNEIFVDIDADTYRINEEKIYLERDFERRGFGKGVIYEAEDEHTMRSYEFTRPAGVDGCTRTVAVFPAETVVRVVMTCHSGRDERQGCCQGGAKR